MAPSIVFSSLVFQSDWLAQIPTHNGRDNWLYDGFNHFIVKCYAGKASFLLDFVLFFFFKWHKTFVQTSFKNINKLEPLRLTWQKPIIKCHGDEQTFFFFFFRKRFTNEMSLQNIKEREKKLLRHTKYYQKTSRLVWYFSTLSK